jgi:hypothetical protein
MTTQGVVQASPRLAVTYDRRTAYLVTCAGAIGTVASQMFPIPGPHGRGITLVAPLVLVLGVSLLLQRQPVLEIDEIGIRCSRWGPSRIFWHEIKSYYWTRFRGAPLVVFEPVDFALLQPRLHWHNRISLPFFKLFSPGVLSIMTDTGLLSVDGARLEAVIRCYLVRGEDRA